MILSNNQEILIDWRTLFYHNLIEKGVSMLHDVIDASSSFLIFEQFQLTALWN